MGVEVGAVRLLCLAAKHGVDFSRTLLLGRQSLHVNRADLSRAMTACGFAYREAIHQADGYADTFFRELGADSLNSMDASDYEGADIVHDLNVPVGEELRERFSVVFDGGTTEHVFNFPIAIANCMQMVEVGGHFIGVTVCNNFAGHGFYQFSPELFFRLFNEANGFALLGVFVFESRRSGVDDGVMYRVSDPAALGRRVLLHNSEETFIAVCAQRVAALPSLTVAPQQSDYVGHWSDGTSNASEPAAKSLKERTRPLRYALRRRWAKVRRFIPQMTASPFEPAAYTRLVMDSTALDAFATTSVSA